MQSEKHLYRNHIEIPVRFSDLDAMGHLNNATYLTYFEEGRADWCRSCLGMEAESIAYPVIVARIEIDYLAPVGFGDVVQVFTRVKKIGGKSLVVEGMILTKTDIPAAKYNCMLVWFDYEKQVAVPVPEAARKMIVDFEPALEG